MDEFFVLPDYDISRENILEPGDIVTKITVAVKERRSLFVKIQERDAWDFAVASVAVSGEILNGKVKNARIVLGGAAPVPWRSKDAEKLLEGKVISEAVAGQVAALAVKGSKPLKENKYKVLLFTNLVRQALLDI